MRGSWNYSDDADRSPSSSFDFDRQGEDRGASWRQPVEQGYVFQRIVRIGLALRSHINDHGRADQSLNWNLVQSAPSTAEMNGRINVGAPMLRCREIGGGIPVACRCCAPVRLFPVKGFVGGPINRLFTEGVGQVYEQREPFRRT